MSTQLVALAVLMGLVTYPWRAAPLLAPGIERLPPLVQAYLRLVAPAILATLAAVTVVITADAGGAPAVRVDAPWLAVAGCVALVAWRRSLIVGLLAAILIVALLRAWGA